MLRNMGPTPPPPDLSDITNWRVRRLGRGRERGGVCGERGRVGANVRIGGSTPGGRLSLSPQRRPVGVVGRSCTDSRIRTRPSSSDDRIDALAQASRRPKTRCSDTARHPHLRRTVQQPPPHHRHCRGYSLGNRRRRQRRGRVGCRGRSSGFYIDVTETLDSTVKASVDVLVNEITLLAE